MSGNGTVEYDTRLFGHPVGLLVLFFTELWERFSYYGMRAILILYLVATIEEGGLGFDAAKAGALYGLYTAMVYLAGLPGGWLADRVLGQRRAVLFGGILIALGHFSIAFPSTRTFYGGLGLIVAGTGLLKPNISAMVGQMYAREDDRRDAGFTFFYMGINFGAFFGPLVCGYLGEGINWHYGFGAAGVGMLLGLTIYVFFGGVLRGAGLKRRVAESAAEAALLRRRLLAVTGAVVVTLVACVSLISAGWIDLVGIADYFGVALVLIAVVFFGWIFSLGHWSPQERKRLIVITVLFLAAAIFWGGYEQAGSSLNLFAKDYTDRSFGDGEFPASFFQSVPAFYVIVLSIAFTILWTVLGRRQPSSPAKFSLGLIFLGLGFVVMMLAAGRVGDGAKVGPAWLMTTYFLHVMGEMCLSPIGLSAVTKLAPERVTGLMMGVWFLASSVGSYFAGRAAGLYESLDLPWLFGVVAAGVIVTGLLLAVLVRPIRNLMGGVH